jgi:hypothetical protein
LQDYSDFRCPFIAKQDIWNRAEEFRAAYWPEKILPVNIEKIIEKRLKLNIQPEHEMLSDFDIDAFLRKDFTGIVVDYDCFMDERFSNRLRFSYAHEIGHLILHKDIYKQISFTSPEEWRDFIENYSDREYGFFEYQANEFAGRLLVPRDVLEKELNVKLDEIKVHGLIDYLENEPSSVLASISTSLGRPFGVSYVVIERRVEREELWPPKI